MDFTWVRGSSTATCIPCGRMHESEHVFEWESTIGTPMLGTRCPQCGAITVHGGEQQFEPDDSFVDGYLQSEGGIDAVLANLYRVDAPARCRFLDVGANYGFAVRYARDVLGWDAVGIEPSYAGRRGAQELGVEIIDQYVTAETQLDGPFDVILASEVIEHVADPSAFVSALRRHLAPGGIIVLTTPAAEVVAPATAEQGIQAIGPGGHLFLFTAASLESFLHRHGFGSVTVVRDGQSLYATAGVEPGLALRAGSTGPAPEQVVSFLRALIDDPGSPPALRSAMTVRHHRALVNLGQDAPEAERAAVEGVRDVHGLDLGDPERLARRLPSLHEVPLLIAPAAFASGMRRIVHRQDWEGAVAYFDLALAAVEEKRRRSHPHDGDTRIIAAQSRAHRLLALLHTDPPAAMREWRRHRESGELPDPSVWAVRLFVEAAALDLRSLFDDDVDVVAEAIVHLGADGGADHATAAINAAHLLCRSAVAQGDRWCATQWASVAEQMLVARSDVLSVEWSESMSALLASTRAELEPLRAEPVPSLVPMPGPEHEAILWSNAAVQTVDGAVSVVMALYQGERYVRAALETIAAQSSPPLEVIVVDDGSVDDSVRILNSVILPCEVRVIRQGNAGQSAARNTGIRAARGEFIAFLDQDDLWAPEHLETLCRAMSADARCAWVYSDFDLIDEDGGTLVTSYLSETAVDVDRRTIEQLVRADIMALPSASLLRRDALLDVRGFDRRLSGYEDDELFLRLYRAGWRSALCRGSRIRYRTHPTGASSSVAFLRSRLVFLQLLVERFPPAIGGAGAAEAAAGRLIRSTTTEYFTALIAADDWLAKTTAWALGRMLPIAVDAAPSHRWRLIVMRRPRLFRSTLRVLAVLPRAARRRLLPPTAYRTSEMLGTRRVAAQSIEWGPRPRWMRRRPAQ